MGQSDIISDANAGLPIKQDERSMGVILVKAGRLTPENAERILRLQREKGLRFGDAAIELGLLTQSDIQFALSRQFVYPFLQSGESKVFFWGLGNEGALGSIAGTSTETLVWVACPARLVWL